MINIEYYTYILIPHTKKAKIYLKMYKIQIME